MNPFKLLLEAHKHSPNTVKAVWGVIAIAAGAAIAIGLFGGDLLHTAGAVFLMLCFLVLAPAVLSGPGPLRSVITWALTLVLLAVVVLSVGSVYFEGPLLTVITWALTLAFLAVVVLSVGSVFFGWPLEWRPDRPATYVRDQSGDILRRFWKPDGENVNEENEKELKEWMGNHGVDSRSVYLFLRSELLADARVQAVQDLKLR